MTLVAHVTRAARMTVDVLLLLLIVFVIAVVVLARILPTTTGGTTFVVGGASMEPTIPVGSAVHVVPIDPTLLQPGTCAAPGAAIYTGPLVGAFFGDAAQGDDTNDRDVASGGVDNLCFSWAFDINANNAYQDATTTATFNFAAEQTAHNP